MEPHGLLVMFTPCSLPCHRISFSYVICTNQLAFSHPHNSPQRYLVRIYRTHLGIMVSEAYWKRREGMNLLSKLKLNKAERKFRDSIDLYLRDGISWLYLGDSLLLQKKIEEAKDAYETCIHYNPDLHLITQNKPMVDVSDSYTHSLIDGKFIDTNILGYSESLLQVGGFSMHLVDRFFNYLEGRHPDKMKQILKLKVKDILSHSYTGDLSIIADLLFGAKRYRDAVRVYGKILEGNPGRWNIRNSMFLTIGVGRLSKWQ